MLNIQVFWWLKNGLVLFLEHIIIAGQQIELTPLCKDELRGVFIDAVLGYSFYKATFNGQRFLLLVSKRAEKSTPAKYKQLSNKLEC